MGNFNVIGVRWLLVVSRCLQTNVLRAMHGDPTSGYWVFMRRFAWISEHFYWVEIRDLYSNMPQTALSASGTSM